MWSFIWDAFKAFGIFSFLDFLEKSAGKDRIASIGKFLRDGYDFNRKTSEDIIKFYDIVLLTSELKILKFNIKLPSLKRTMLFSLLSAAFFATLVEIKFKTFTNLGNYPLPKWRLYANDEIGYKDVLHYTIFVIMPISAVFIDYTSTMASRYSLVVSGKFNLSPLMAASFDLGLSSVSAIFASIIIIPLTIISVQLTFIAFFIIVMTILHFLVTLFAIIFLLIVTWIFVFFFFLFVLMVYISASCFYLLGQFAVIFITLKLLIWNYLFDIKLRAKPLSLIANALGDLIFLAIKSARAFYKTIIVYFIDVINTYTEYFWGVVKIFKSSGEAIGNLMELMVSIRIARDSDEILERVGELISNVFSIFSFASGENDVFGYYPFILSSLMTSGWVWAYVLYSYFKRYGSFFFKSSEYTKKYFPGIEDECVSVRWIVLTGMLIIYMILSAITAIYTAWGVSGVIALFSLMLLMELKMNIKYRKIR